MNPAGETISDLQRLRYCESVLQSRCESEQAPNWYWRAKLKVARFVRKRLESAASDDAGDVPGLSESEEAALRDSESLLQPYQPVFPPAYTVWTSSVKEKVREFLIQQSRDSTCRD